MDLVEYIRPAVFIGCFFAKNSSHEFEGWFRKNHGNYEFGLGPVLYGFKARPY